jgi:hypothetical protein
VLIAEDITSRFLNVVSLFNGTLPLIAIQMQALRIGEKVTLVFTTVMDELSRGYIDEDEDAEAAPTDRAYWENRASKATVGLADQLLVLIKGIDPSLELKYNKFYIGLAKDGVPFNFITFRPRKKQLQFEPKIPQSDDLDAEIDKAGIDTLEYSTEVFAGLPAPPADWNNPQTPLFFKMPTKEREYLRRKLALLRRPGDGAQSLLARLVESRDFFQGKSSELPQKLDAHADSDDKRALGVARDAAALTAIGRTVYGALVEQLRGLDGGADGEIYRAQLSPYFATYGEAAGRCNLDVLEAFLPELPLHVRNVLRETRAYVRNGKPENFTTLRDSYQRAEVTRKTGRRARLLDTERSAQRRSEWDSGRHNTTPLHYRWDIVRDMLADLSGP